MIRINLLQGAQAPAEASEVVHAASGTPKSALFILLGAVLVVAAHYFYLQRQAANLQQELVRQQAEAVRLNAVKLQFQALTAKQARLSGRIAIIRRLDNRRSGPYDFLVRLGHSVVGTSQLWLTSCVEKRNQVTLTGRALNLNALAYFITRMRGYGFRHVRLGQAREQKSAAGVPEFYFQLQALLASAPAASAPGPRS